MAHIDLKNDQPGILGPMVFRPQTAYPLNLLAETLLRGSSTLTSGERETIAAFTSRKNNCKFCSRSHGAAAAHHLGGAFDHIEQVFEDADKAELTDKMRALLKIADKVRQGGLQVTPEDIALAKDAGADDIAIHDTVLIAAAFCMFNRYVDGLGTWGPDDNMDAYRDMGQMLAERGYLASSPN